MIIIEINDVYRYSEFKRRFSWMKILLGKKRGGVMRKRGGVVVVVPKEACMKLRAKGNMVKWFNHCLDLHTLLMLKFKTRGMSSKLRFVAN